jgi:hypothetical protein
MSRMIISVSFVVVLLLSFGFFPGPGLAGDFVGGVAVGTTGGLGVQTSATLANFTRDLPLSARFTVGYHTGNAGDPYAARRVFINDNTNGTPEDSAHQWQFRFDLLFPIFHLGPQEIFLFGGPRHARYTANFNYVGGNENFDVTASPWGAGLGLETRFVISDQTSFQVQLGVDYYQDVELAGHDTIYTPDGDHVNPRDGYDYSDADDAVDQPSVEILAMMGLLVGF